MIPLVMTEIVNGVHLYIDCGSPLIQSSPAFRENSWIAFARSYRMCSYSFKRSATSPDAVPAGKTTINAAASFIATPAPWLSMISRLSIYH